MNFSCLIALLFCCCFFFFDTHLSEAADSISPGQSLTGDQTITSKEGNFVLGFFTPGNSNNYYIGIWYKKVREQTIVWVANREAPLPDKSSQLKISEDGNLVLINQTNIPVWSTNINSNASNSTVAVLHDNGNLVLSDGSNSSAVFWQSFNYPTDTWLPTGRLGLNKITGRKQQLTSWRSKEDPAPGPFSFEIDSNGTSQFIIVWNGFRRYWTSGEWNGQFFSLAPEMTSNNLYNNLIFITDKSGTYFNYSALNPSLPSRIVMNVFGQLEQSVFLTSWTFFWYQPKAQCEVFSLCGSFGMCNEKALPLCDCVKGFEARSQEEWNLSDWSGGCVRKTHLRCENNSSVNGEDDKFLQMSNMLFPEKPISLTVSSIDDCKLRCLNNCSCTAYAYNSGCSIWSGDLMNLRVASDNQGKELYLRLAASETTDDARDGLNSSGRKRMLLIIVSTIVIIGVILSATIVYCLWRRIKKKVSGDIKLHRSQNVSAFGENKRDLDVSFYEFGCVREATENFLDSNKLGQGGFGPVYKGRLPEGQEIAAKRLSKNSGQGQEEFKNEVMLIGKLQHRNLVRLLGYCIKEDELILLYEYMPNKSLDYFLFGSHL